ncbi:MAG: efflux RND transporter periplasmic adaptor subunit [Planctomycetota bacterium]|nr:MAG: efflux RND transporter periplasmic adaptor subunit [Planctomycetota bacterium]
MHRPPARTTPHLGLAVLATIAGAFAGGCRRPPPPLVDLPPAEVVVAHPVVRDVTAVIEFTGNATAVETVDIKPRVTGFITEVHFRDGQDVRRGDPLFDIDDRSYDIIRDEALAEIERQQVELQELQAEVARNEALLPRGAVTQEQVGIITAKRDMAQALLAKDRALLRQAELDLEFCRLTAPIDGRIGIRNVNVGDLVTGGGSATTLTTIVSVDPVYVTFFCDERSLLLARERAARAARAAAPAGATTAEVEWKDIRDLRIPVDMGLVTDEGFPHRGWLTFVDIAVRASTGTIRCRAILDNPGRLITPGMFVRVRLAAGDPAPATLVRDRAIGIDQGRRTVAVVGADDRVEIRQVTIGSLNGTLRVVTAGLTADDRVVIGGLQRAREGAVVKPLDAPME